MDTRRRTGRHDTWSYEEIDLLRSFVHHSTPGGLNKKTTLSWDQIAKNMSRDAAGMGIIYGSYAPEGLRHTYKRNMYHKFSEDANTAREELRRADETLEHANCVATAMITEAREAIEQAENVHTHASMSTASLAVARAIAADQAAEVAKNEKLEAGRKLDAASGVKTSAVNLPPASDRNSRSDDFDVGGLWEQEQDEVLMDSVNLWNSKRWGRIPLEFIWRDLSRAMKKEARSRGWVRQDYTAESIRIRYWRLSYLERLTPTDRAEAVESKWLLDFSKISISRTRDSILKQ